MKKILTLAVMAALLGTTLSGCSSHSGNVHATDQNAIERIKIGETSKDEVRSALGNAGNIHRHGGKETWTYTYTQTNIGARAFIP